MATLPRDATARAGLGSDAESYVRRDGRSPVDSFVEGIPSAAVLSSWAISAADRSINRADITPGLSPSAVALQLRGPAARDSGSRGHDDLFRSCLRTSWDRPHRGDLVALEPEDEQSVRPRDLGLRAWELATEGGLAIGACGH